ncbi:MAG: glycosyltransferase family 4 protein, partial [Acidimicrobiia bacterium]|nr:glycosyltransferase family 4 protein [Acidimicrobiia bacterium]
VVAYNRGSMVELIEHTKTGFIAGDLQEASDFVRLVDAVDRHAIRASVADRFTVSVMVDRYVAPYRRVLAGRA